MCKSLRNLLIVCMVIFGNYRGVYAQLPPNQPEQDCINAIPVCTNVYTQTNSYQGPGRITGEIPNDNNCLPNGELNDVWYILTIQQAGNLCFTITPTDPTDDYDWAVFNMTNSSCQDIAADPSLAVSCNDRKAVSCNGQTGPNGNVGNCGGQNEPCIPVQEGETYLINISNFVSNNGGYILDLSASTAVIFDDIPPRLDAVDHTCGNTSVSVFFSENVLCSTVRPRDFTFSGPGGVYSVTNVTSFNCEAPVSGDSTFAREFELEISPPITGGGTYTISLVDEVLDACRNIASLGSQTVEIEVIDATLDAQPDTICEGDTTLLSVSLANPNNFSISWTPGNLTGPSIQVAPDTTTTYSVEIVDNTGCLIFTDNIEVSVVPRPTATFSAPIDICSGETGTISYTGNAPLSATYNWNFEGGTIISGIGQGPYQIQWDVAGPKNLSLSVDVNGCTSSIEQSGLTVFQTPSMELDIPDNACEESPAIIRYLGSASNNASYQWNFGAGLITSNNGSSAGPGPHSIEFQDNGLQTVSLSVTENGCSNQISQNITIFPKPIAEIAPVDTQCLGTHSFSFAYSGPNTNISSFVWDFGDGNGSTLANPTYRYNTPGVKEVELGILDQNGCIDIAQTTFEIFEDPTAAFSVTSACEGDRVVFQNLSSVPSSTEISQYIWDYGDATGSSQINPSHRYAASGNYFVTLQAVTAEGCRDTSSIEVPVFPKPDANYVVQGLCVGFETVFKDVTQLDNSNGDRVVDYFWDFGDGNTSRGRGARYLYSAEGTYQTQLVVVTNNGCEDSVTQEVTIFPSNLPISPVGDTVCFGKPAFLSVSDFPPGATINWYDEPGSRREFFQGLSLITDPLVNAQTFYAEAISPEGCISQRIAVEADIIDRGIGQIFASDTLVEIPNAIVNFRMEGTIQGRDFFWNFGDGETSTSDAPAHEYQYAGTYNVELGVIDQFDCEYRFNLVVVVTKDAGFQIPSGFTPNGDGINDEFFLVPRLVRQFSIQIFNRWGKLVFESSDPNFRWNGLGMDGQSQPEGVYTYRAQAQDEDGDLYQQLGTITLLR